MEGIIHLLTGTFVVQHTCVKSESESEQTESILRGKNEGYKTLKNWVWVAGDASEVVTMSEEEELAHLVCCE